MVKRVPGIIRHSAVHRYIGAETGNRLDGSDCVQGDACRRDQRAPRFQNDVRQGKVPLAADGAHFVAHIPDDGGIIHSAVVFRIGDAQPPAQIQLVRDKSGCLAYRCHEINHDAGGIHERVAVKYLRTDMAVETAQGDMRQSEGVARDVQRLPRLNRGAELGIHPSGRNCLMGVRVNAGRDAQENGLNPAGVRRQPFQCVQLFAVVRHEGADAHFQCVPDVPVGLVVPVKIYARRRESGAAGGVQLPAGHAVHAHAFLGGDAVHMRTAQRLGGVQRQSILPERLQGRLPVYPAHPAHGVLVHDIERRAVRLRQFKRIRPADGKVSCLIDRQVRVE